MSQMADITVFDGASPPVSHTLKAVSVVNANGVIEAIYREDIATLPREAQVRAVVKQKTLPSGVVHTETRVSVPVMESVSGQNAAGYTAAPRVAYEDTTVISSYSHPRSTATSRRLCRQIAINLANNVSTSVAAATSGPVPEAMDNLRMPT